MPSGFLIYGSYGYTGSLIVRMASELGMRPVLAGRDSHKTKQQAESFGLGHRTFSLDDAAALDSALKEVAVVLHCAGPFSHTARQMADACLRTKTHYLDITGEIEVFESLARRDAEAKAAGVMLLPGAGYDVVPSDCLAAHLKRRLPSATRLTLAIQGTGRISHGTATTAVENIDRGGLIRRDGKLTKVPAAWKNRLIDFGNGPTKAVTIPWGDVSTAYNSTGIPNIEVYAAMPGGVRTLMAASRYLGWLLGSKPVQSFLKSQIKKQPPGPSDGERERGKSLLWGEVEDDSGNKMSSRLRGPEGYTLTAMTALAIVERVLAGNFRIGFSTPSLAYGADFIMEMKGVAREDLG